MAKNLISVKSIRRVIVIDAAGIPHTIHRRRRKKRRNQTMVLKPLERAHRTLMEAVHDSAGEYLNRHERSNRTNRDGWIQDLGDNTWRANRKALKRMRKAFPGS